jgi:hypothetical protein
MALTPFFWLVTHHTASAAHQPSQFVAKDDDHHLARICELSGINERRKVS